MFKSLNIHGWRQFAEVDIRFHDRLTVLTGANASGKTTLLNVLARHFGWDVPLVRTPATWKKRWLNNFFKSYWNREPDPLSLPEDSRQIGHIVYSSGDKSILLDAGGETPTFQLNIQGQQPVQGLNVPSHRPVPTYQSVDAIPAHPRTKQQAFNNYMNEVRSRYLSGRSHKSTTFHIKETLISLAMGFGNEKIPRRSDLVETLEGFEEVLRKMLPETLGFVEIGFDIPEVYLNTATGPIPFDAISGGIASILDIGWQIYMYSPGDESFVVVIDEPENHLHPALQRILLGNLLAAFPQVQFIVATHSPFVVGAVEDSNVYVLDYTEDKVNSTFLEEANKSASADAILREVLGVPSTFPEWVEDELQEIVSQFSDRPMTAEHLRAMRDRLEERGLGEQLLEVINETIRIHSK